MSITLSIPPAIEHDARIYAESHGTSLNAMVTDFLSAIVDRDARRADDARQFRDAVAEAAPSLNGSEPYRFSRADAYDRE
ncbi:MAG: hypothetical protein IKO40_05950 [Kiritimatiellae bacterium]|nr:hypothetical protein [Kiritimatiellia bacterium]